MRSMRSHRLSLTPMVVMMLELGVPRFLLVRRHRRARYRLLTPLAVSLSSPLVLLSRLESLLQLHEQFGAPAPTTSFYAHTLDIMTPAHDPSFTSPNLSNPTTGTTAGPATQTHPAMHTNTATTSSIQLQARSASTSGHPVDIERNASTSVSTSSRTVVTSAGDDKGDENGDPFQLRDRVLSEDELATLRSRFRPKGPFGNFGGFGMGIVGSSGTRRGRALEEYHVKQNNILFLFLFFFAHPIPPFIHRFVPFLVALSGLFYAAISSLSLSLISTGIDSVFDVGSNLLLFYLHRKAIQMRKDEKKWPVGGARLECIGNIVFGFLMSSVNLVVIVESVRAIISKEGSELHKFHLPALLAVCASLAVKGCLFLYSYGLKKHSSQVQILWEDHRNDLVLNGFAIITSTGGSKIVWWLDPAGAIALGLFIIISWGRTIYSEFTQLAGKAAPHEFMQLLTYKAATFSEAIERVDTVRAYHSGPNYFVEVDIVMDGASTLYTAHDLSQSLQDKLESLPGVERAFVHVDYETDHTPEHRKRKLA
ncbi:hypothetical protein D9619_011202 [Psilocybe cf. subviscida]|uniref:Cation efflux protein cytoplasmic domain-containing protein n=1 Tax=Psilocybe cf. subviscida TaxID=2480587 RepID=A0A8H5BKC1_9AGAR|nr:hypothetical protein D9619_011202 [Psilocybe cf. subviscida]